ncbi:Transforming growth factor beta regulator 1 [Lamellibrachia satsuma]|nr:Transforming growth factor beta regulator 1 [Lamellibrachia satsuma]
MNAAVCDEVVRLEDKVIQTKEERRFLLKHVFQQQAMSTMLGQMVAGKQPAVTMAASPIKGGSACIGSGGTRLASQSVAQLLGEAEKRSKKKAASTPTAGGSTSGKKKAAGVSREIHNGPVSEDTLKLKLAKKAKMSCKRLVQSIPLDNTGRPILPIELGNLVVYCLGEIVSDRPGFHTTEYIYPVGFCSTRVYASVHDSHTKCLYTCKIQDGGTSTQFEISPEDARGQSFMGTTASECHKKLLDAVLKNRSSELSTLENKGPEFFGFSHPTIQNLIQSCPGARKCSSYEWQKFEVTKDSTEKYTPPMEDNPLVNFDALQKFISSLQGATQPREVEASASPLQQSASLRSLLTSGPLQAPPTSGC